MLKISEILSEHQDISFELFRERPFRFLALSASVLDEPVCIFLDSIKYIQDIKPHVTMIITTQELATVLSDERYGLCIVEKPRLFFFELHNLMRNHPGYQRKQVPTVIGKDSFVHPLSSISKNNVIIGDHVTIEEFVVIRENTVIGDHTIIRAGSVLGGEGYEFKRTGQDISSVKHMGGVIIGEHVEIQYNSCVDKAVYPWDDTMIGDYTKIDNLVHIAHAVKIANNVMVVALSGVGGRTIIKEDTWIGFGAIITNGIEIGRDARANIGSVVTQSIPDQGSYSGNFAIEHAKFIRHMKKMVKEDES